MIYHEEAAKELAEWLAQQEGITDVAEAARLVVAAALGGEPLYRIDQMRLAEVNAIPYPLIEEALEMLDDESVLIRVWPKEALPSADDVYGILKEE